MTIGPRTSSSPTSPRRSTRRASSTAATRALRERQRHSDRAELARAVVRDGWCRVRPARSCPTARAADNQTGARSPPSLRPASSGRPRYRGAATRGRSARSSGKFRSFMNIVGTPSNIVARCSLRWRCSAVGLVEARQQHELHAAGDRCVHHDVAVDVRARQCRDDDVRRVVRPCISEVIAVLSRIEAWRSTAPFGRPVVPDV